CIDNILIVDIFLPWLPPRRNPKNTCRFHRLHSTSCLRWLKTIAMDTASSRMCWRALVAKSGSVQARYRSIQRLMEQGLIIESAERPAPELDDERRRYYRLRTFGRAVARAEAARLADLVKQARVCGLVTGKA
ncbi:MAG TPA: hypothetical protein VEX68_25140, partial [Bryobacteraceae bacterium]|nr:hypothetical protein [Bryobacteraceae bacterium]